MLDALRYQNGAGETLSFTRLSYLLSGFALEREDGTWEELPESYAWLDVAKRTPGRGFGRARCCRPCLEDEQGNACHRR